MHDHPRPFAIQYPARTRRKRSCAALTNSKVSRNGGLVGRKFYVACFEGFWRRYSRTRAANWLPLSIRADSGRKCGGWSAGKLCMLAKESERRLPPFLCITELHSSRLVAHLTASMSVQVGRGHG